MLISLSVLVFAEDNSTISNSTTQTCIEKTTNICIIQQGRSATQVIKILPNCDKTTAGEWCDYGCDNGVCNNPPVFEEQVKCIFDNSNDIQSCYAGEGKFVCSGVGTCVANVFGDKGKKLNWLSTCEGEADTVIDGDNEYAEFKCVSETNNNETISDFVKEQIKCVFKNSATEQKCYTAEDNSRFSCSGIENCIIDVDGKKGEKLTWKSSCGGYAYTRTDGDNDYAEFNCLPEGNTTTEMIIGKGFRYAYWQCYNGEEQKQGSESSCKSSETWQNYAKEFCQDKCYKDKSKCGVNSFSIAEDCYLENFVKPEVVFVLSIEEEKKQEGKITEEKKEEILICKDSCPFDGKCYPFGYRKSNKFCFDDGSFVEQLKEESECENNFECSSNVCISGKCISEGLLQKILNWFKKLFG